MWLTGRLKEVAFVNAVTHPKVKRAGICAYWITAAGMFCIVNIHWDGGWIDSSYKARFPDTYATFSAEAERK